VNALPPRERAALREFVGLGLQVSDVESPPVEHRSAIDRPPDQREGERDGDRAVMSDEQKLLAVPAEDGGVERLAQAGGALRDGVEHRLDVCRRAADDAQDLAGRRLLLQRFREIAVPRLQLLEQAHVFNGDDRLVREGLEQGDLPLGEELGLGATEVDDADRAAFSDQGDAQ